MIIKAKVTPNSKEEKIEKLEDGSYKISVKEPAEDNKANIRLINILSKELNTNHKNIKIKTLTSREKIIEVKTE